MSVSGRGVDAHTIFAFVAAASLQQAGIWSHVAWGDEIQAVILARDSNTLSEWYWNFRYEGHPPLWHLYLKGWLVAGLDPLSALKAAASSLSLIVMGLIYFASPFTLPLKILVSLSEPVLFQFGVISRSYTLGMAILFTAVALWRVRGGWLVIPALAGVSVQFVFIAMVLVIARLRARLAWRACALLVLVASFASVLVSRPARDYGFTDVERAPRGLDGVLRSLIEAGQVIATQFPFESADRFPVPAFLLLVAMVTLALPTVLIRVLRSDPFWVWAVGAFILFTSAISTFVYPLYYRHYALLVPLVIAAWWLSWPRYCARSTPRMVWLCVLAFAGLAKVALGFNFPYSNAPEVGEWVRQHEKDIPLVIVAPKMLGTELAPHVRETYKLGGDCLQTFVIFRAPDSDLAGNEPYHGDKLKILSPETFSASVKDAAGLSGGAALLVANSDWASALIDLDDPSIKLERVIDQTRRRPHARFIFNVRAYPNPGPAPPRCSTRPAAG